MLKINYTHNKIQDGNFPIDKLNAIEGITCTKVLNSTRVAVLKFTQEKYLIEVDMADSDETPEEVAFHLGMLIHSCLQNNH